MESDARLIQLIYDLASDNRNRRQCASAQLLSFDAIRVRELYSNSQAQIAAKNAISAIVDECYSVSLAAGFLLTAWDEKALNLEAINIITQTLNNNRTTLPAIMFLGFLEKTKRNRSWRSRIASALKKAFTVSSTPNIKSHCIIFLSKMSDLGIDFQVESKINDMLDGSISNQIEAINTIEKSEGIDNHRLLCFALNRVTPELRQMVRDAVSRFDSQ